MIFQDHRSGLLLVGILTLFVNGCGGGYSGNSGGAGRSADVIIAIDSSASVDEEAVFVENLINGFASTVAADGIDLRIIVIADGSQFCAPAPLGSGTCPGDENLPGYRRVFATIGSTNAFNRILGTYLSWGGSIRTNATKTIIVVSDDDSATTGASFTASLLALYPSFTGYRFNAVVASTFATLPGFCFGLSSTVGAEYISLATNTGGVFVDLCLRDFGPGFADMAAAIIVDLP